MKKTDGSNLNKQLQCVRQVANMSVLKPEHKFENKHYNPQSFARIQQYSPKLAKLMAQINELDEKDMKNHGKLFKHFIFSDLDKGYGAKLVASMLLANKFKLVYKKAGPSSIALDDDNITKSNSKYKFALLSSRPVFGVPISAKMKKAVLNLFNERPSNAHGTKCRFIVLDAGFKEGIDLFDVKYVHILEPQTSTANTKQAIGRATRTCGQKGLEFIPKKGWPLDVFIYDTKLTEGLEHTLGVQTMHALFMTGTDLRLLQFSDELQKYSVISSIDYKLNKNIHNFKIEDEDLALTVFDSNKEFGIMQGGYRHTVDCKAKCGKTPSPAVPVTVSDMILAWLSLGRLISKTRKERLREYFCTSMKQDVDFCERLNEVHANDKAFIKKYGIVLNMYYKHLSPIYQPQIQKRLAGLKGVNVRPFEVKQALVQALYSKFAWPKAELKNMCLSQNTGSIPPKFVFTPTQDFIRHYFTPTSIEKGMLLTHSVGTGKTCTAIATATTSFEPEGYTILWVTRTTLKSDVYKNLFEQICHVVLQEKLDKGLIKLPSKFSDRKKLLSKSWKIPPLSYKQFTNLVTKKNKKLYDQLVQINGTHDPLRKTLLIIDEAHKLYGGDDLSAQERPNMPKLHSMLQHSYKTSGEDSVKVLLMTATPMTNDPMEMIKLLNLIREDQLPCEFDKFSTRFLDKNGAFSKRGKVEFMDEVSGYISYLNRELDARQFAQAHVQHVLVPMSVGETEFSNKKDISTHFGQLNQKVKTSIQNFETQKKRLKIEKTDVTKRLKLKKIGDDVKSKLESTRASIENGIEILDARIQENKQAAAKNKKEMKYAVEELMKDESQFKILSEKCGVKQSSLDAK